MKRHELEKRLKRMRRVPASKTHDRRMSNLFRMAGREASKDDLESRLEKIQRVPVPESLDRRMERMFGGAEQAAPVPRPWRMPVWAAATIGLILMVSILFRGAMGPEPVVVDITSDGQLGQFLLGVQTAPNPAGLDVFTRGSCSMKTVWPADAPEINRQPMTSDRTTGGVGQ